MKKGLKVLLGIIAAGAAASAAAVAINRHRNSRGDFIFEEDDPFDEDGDDSDGDYRLTPEEEEELIGTDDHDFGAEDSKDESYKKLGMKYDVSILDPVDVAFAKYMLDGIRNIGRIMYGRMEDIERLTRRRNISNSDKLGQIRCLCAQNKENYELLCRCADNVEGTVCENTPEDFWEFYADYEEREGNGDAE